MELRTCKLVDVIEPKKIDEVGRLVVLARGRSTTSSSSRNVSRWREAVVAGIGIVHWATRPAGMPDAGFCD